MIKVAVAALVLFSLFLSTGFDTIIAARNEIQNLFIVTTVGIDVGEEQDNVKLLVVTKEIGSEKENASKDDKKKYFTAEGETIFGANRNFHSFMSKDIFWGHIDIIIMSHELVEEKMANNLDFFIGDHESRLDSLLFVVKDSTAEELIQIMTDSGEDITETINMLIGGVGALSITSEMDLLSVSKQIVTGYSAIYIPVLLIKEDESKREKSEKSDEKSTDKPDSKSEGKPSSKKDLKVQLNGYAFFDNTTHKLSGFLLDHEARGFNWVIDRVVSGTINVRDKKNKKVSLEIIEATPTIEAEMKDEEIKVILKINMSSNIVDQTGTVDLINDKSLNSLNIQQETLIKNEIRSALNFATEKNLDIFAISSVISHKYPIKWNKIKDKWREVYSTIEFKIEVEGKIERVYMTNTPIIVEKSEK